MPIKTLHIAPLDKFIPPFIEFIRREFSNKDQYFYTYGDIDKFSYEIKEDTHHVGFYNSKIKELSYKYFPLLYKMYKAEKIILHGLFDKNLLVILTFNPWLLKKCYWVIWGADLYSYRNDISPKNRYKKIREVFRRFVIKNIGFLVTYIKGDVELAKEWYGAKGKYCECIMYLSNVYHEINSSLKENKDSKLIQVGNSADPSNNHIEAFEKIIQYNSENIKIHCPLSYGDKRYANYIIKKGYSFFSDNFIPMTDFMSFDNYLKYMSDVDIVVFNHNRQQAMGNIINYLGAGKTVYMRKNTTQWELMKKLNLNIRDVNEFNIELISELQKKNNNEIIKNYFSYDKLCNQWNNIIS